VRQGIFTRLTDESDDVQRAAVRVLGRFVGADSDIRQAILEKLFNSRSEHVRQTAVEALSSLVSTDLTIRQIIFIKLDNEMYHVQRAAVRALGGLVGTDSAVRQSIFTKLDNEDAGLRGVAIEGLASLVTTDTAIREAILAKLQDESSDMRQVAIEGLASLVTTDTAIREAILAKLQDESSDVRQTAVEALIPLLLQDKSLRLGLLPWLGMKNNYAWSTIHTRRLLANTYALLLPQDHNLLTSITALLTSSAWPTRQGAAWALIAMPGGPPPHLLPQLRGLLDDLRTEENWPERLQAAEVFLNARDPELSRHAITLALEALDYATQPWYGIPREGAQVRQTAARILGQLDPLYRDDTIFARLARVLEEDEDENVRDAAYGALLRLAAAPEVVADKQ